MDKQLVTIGVTVFNAEDTIRSAINSALDQTWQPLEIVVVDDFSTDKSLEILNELVEKNENIRVFRNKSNQGVAASRNRIIKESSGEFLVFFDDDDVSNSKRVELQVKRIIDYENCFANGAPVICHTSRRVIYPDGNYYLARTMGTNLDSFAPFGEAVAERILIGKPLKNAYGACPTCSQMARLDTYKRLTGFDPVFKRSEDTEFNLRLALEGGHFAGIDEPLVTQYMTKTSEKSLEDEFRYTYLLLEKHRQVADKYGLYSYCKDWIAIKHKLLAKQFIPPLLLIIKNFFLHPVITIGRIYSALPSLKVNRHFSNFHCK